MKNKQLRAQMSFFDSKHPLRIDKPIRLIELFAGYGSQALALKYLGIPFEHYRIAEWATKSIQAYKDLHFGDDDTDYSASLSIMEVFDRLYAYGISSDYNSLMTKDNIKRMGEKKARQIYNCIQATHNLVSVCNVHGTDLSITDTDKYTYILTYSFPCQDLSLAGKRAGMAKDSDTRSGMLWEVERILNECNELGELPQILLMENVPQVVGEDNMPHCLEWTRSLERFGYKSKYRILNATEYGIPQNRERCFMVSWLGDYYYDFPKPIGCEHRLKHVLEREVDESYYLKKGTVIKLNEHKTRHEAQVHGFGWQPIDANENGGAIAHTIQTESGYRLSSNFIIESDASYGVMTETSESYTAPPLKDISRAITSKGKNGVLEAPPKQLMRADGILLGKSPDFQRGNLPDISRTIDTNGTNGVVEWINPNANK